MQETKWEKFVHRLGIGWLAIFFAFFLSNILLGGSASSGYITDGSYFLGDKGIYIAVHPLVWYFSKTLGVIVFLYFVILFPVLLIHNLTKHLPMDPK